MELDWSLDLPPKFTEFNSNTILLSSPQPNSTTYSGTAQLTFGPNVGGNTTANLSLGSSDVFTITIHDSRLSGGAKSVSVTRTDPASTIGSVTAQLVQAITSDADLKALGVKARNVANAYFENSIKFRGDAETLPSANTIEFNQQLSTSAPVLSTGVQTNFTYDANGNMTSDGTNTYEWDAENRLIKITYPGTGNNSQLSYDPIGRNVKIIENAEGSPASTKQFVWCGSLRCEERDGSGVLTKQFFSLGQRNSSSNYFYSRNHLNTVCEMTDNSGTIQAQYASDPFGRVAKVQGSLASDFEYGGYYVHRPSGLDLTLFRQYSANIGRWLSRDPVEESGGYNLYGYVENDPIRKRDPAGLQAYVAPVSPPTIAYDISLGLLQLAAMFAASQASPTSLDTQGAHPPGQPGPVSTDPSHPTQTNGVDPLESQEILNNFGTSGVTPSGPKSPCGKCPPCPPNLYWSHPGNEHGSSSGTHYHGIEWHQNPACVCFPKRVSGPTPYNMK